MLWMDNCLLQIHKDSPFNCINIATLSKVCALLTKPKKKQEERKRKTHPNDDGTRKEDESDI